MNLYVLCYKYGHKLGVVDLYGLKSLYVCYIDVAREFYDFYWSFIISYSIATSIDLFWNFSFFCSYALHDLINFRQWFQNFLHFLCFLHNWKSVEFVYSISILFIEIYSYISKFFNFQLYLLGNVYWYDLELKGVDFIIQNNFFFI